jgi:hypothetical protein
LHKEKLLAVQAKSIGDPTDEGKPGTKLAIFKI